MANRYIDRYAEIKYSDGRYYGCFVLNNNADYTKFPRFTDRVRSGFGVFISNDGLRYQGKWVNDSLKRGILIGGNFEYIGQFNNGKIEGNCVIIYNGKPVLSGQFKGF